MSVQYGSNSLTVAQARQDASTVFLAKVFNWMAIGLGLTGVVAFFTAGIRWKSRRGSNRSGGAGPLLPHLDPLLQLLRRNT